MLDSSRLDKKAVQEIVRDHRDVLKRFEFYDLDYNFDETDGILQNLHSYEGGYANQKRECPEVVPTKTLISPSGSVVRYYADKTYEDLHPPCAEEDVVSVRIILPVGAVDYFLRRNKDGVWTIREIIPKLEVLINNHDHQGKK